MKKLTMLCATLLWLLAALLPGCTSDSQGSGTATGVDVSGTWSLSAEGETSTMTLHQNGDTLTGSVQGVPLTGSVNGNSVAISTGFSSGPLLVADGTVEGATMGGSYTATQAGGTQHTGTWSATKQ